MHTNLPSWKPVLIFSDFLQQQSSNVQNDYNITKANLQCQRKCGKLEL